MKHFGLKVEHLNKLLLGSANINLGVNIEECNFKKKNVFKHSFVLCDERGQYC